jgi:flavin-binding protein dodecin
MSVCQEIQLTGTSSQSWERAAAVAIRRAIESFADRCIVRHVNQSGYASPNFVTEVVKFDVTLKDNGEIDRYLTTVKVSFVQPVHSSSNLTAPRRS